MSIGRQRLLHHYNHKIEGWLHPPARIGSVWLSKFSRSQAWRRSELQRSEIRAQPFLFLPVPGGPDSTNALVEACCFIHIWISVGILKALSGNFASANKVEAASASGRSQAFKTLVSALCTSRGWPHWFHSNTLPASFSFFVSCKLRGSATPGRQRKKDHGKEPTSQKTGISEMLNTFSVTQNNKTTSFGPHACHKCGTVSIRRSMMKSVNSLWNSAAKRTRLQDPNRAPPSLQTVWTWSDRESRKSRLVICESSDGQNKVDLERKIRCLWCSLASASADLCWCGLPLLLWSAGASIHSCILFWKLFLPRHVAGFQHLGLFVVGKLNVIMPWTWPCPHACIYPCIGRSRLCICICLWMLQSDRGRFRPLVIITAAGATAPHCSS